MKKKTKNRYVLIHEFYEKLIKLLSVLEKETGEVLEVQINKKK